jgi:DNA adenine methylase
VLFCKPLSSVETVNDLHGDLTNLAWVIQDQRLGPALYRRLRRVLSSQEEFAAALAEVRASDSPDERPDLERAYHYFIASWQGLNGVSGTSAFNTNFARRFSSNGGDAGARWVGAVQSIPTWRRRMERVNVLRSDGLELCEKIEDKAGTVIYADPPYLKKGASYLHDFDEGDHKRLAKALARFRLTRIVVSYYEDPRLDVLYPRWTKRPLDVVKALVQSGKRDKRGATKAPEVLLINGRSLVERERAPSLFGQDDAE